MFLYFSYTVLNFFLYSDLRPFVLFLDFVNTKIYQNIYKYIQDIQDIYKIPGGGQAAATRPGPEARVPVRHGRLGAGPGRRRLAAAWYFVYILNILYMFLFICIHFDIFWYCNLY